MNKLQVKKLMETKCPTCKVNDICEGYYQYNCITEGFIFYNKEEEKENMNSKDKLELMLENQKQLQENTMGHKFQYMTEIGRARYIKDMILWTTDELHEALHELPYAKDWSKKYDKPDYDHEKQWKLFKEEMIDAWHFFMNIMLAAGFTPEEIFKMYMEKSAINVERQQNGY